MPDDYLKESFTKAHGMRNGEPKRPESLIEMPSMVPEVPEVSLCFNQEKNQPPKSNKALSFDGSGNYLDHYQQNHDLNEMLHRSKFESYNTWKAKNAEALHNITGGLGRIEIGSKQAINTKRSGGIVRRQNSGNESFPTPITLQRSPINRVFEHINPAQENGSHTGYSPQISDPSQMYNQPCYQLENTGQAEPKHQFTQNHPRNSQQTENNMINTSSPSCNSQSHNNYKDRGIENMQYINQIKDKHNQSATPVCCIPNYCNKTQCSCGNQNGYVNYPTANQFVTVNDKPGFTKLSESKGSTQFQDCSKLHSSVDSGLVNSHFVSLSHMINIQKEQISMLCQEVISQKMIMSVLLDEIKQIRVAVSLNKEFNLEMSRNDKQSCHCCNHGHKNDQVIRSETSQNSVNGQTNQNDNSKAKQTMSSPNSVEKKSVGIMTSSLENSSKTRIANNEEKTKENEGHHHVGKKSKKSRSLNSPPKNIQVIQNESSSSQTKEKRELDSDCTQKRKGKKEKSNKGNQSEDSFSLDEAAVIVTNETEQGNVSPEVSIHVNMPDYSASSAESGSSDSFDSEDEGQDSGSDDESSDPQIGWTFYDRVVGQVNNILKKTSHDPRQDYTNHRKKSYGNVLQQYHEDYETENNWSKRVTFDGPPLEDSDNGLHMHRYPHMRANQDLRMPGGPERVQDLLVCDYANGGNNLSLVNASANMSFATYRYYQRHQLLPPPDHVFPNPHHGKKKNKSKKNEKTPPKSQKSHKRSGGPPSKILDMSALKQQPKLF